MAERLTKAETTVTAQSKRLNQTKFALLEDKMVETGDVCLRWQANRGDVAAALSGAASSVPVSLWSEWEDEAGEPALYDAHNGEHSCSIGCMVFRGDHLSALRIWAENRVKLVTARSRTSPSIIHRKVAFELLADEMVEHDNGTLCFRWTAKRADIAKMFLSGHGIGEVMVYLKTSMGENRGGSPYPSLLGEAGCSIGCMTFTEADLLALKEWALAEGPH